ncbi:uncharacterized protein PHACADRAFT_262601, partial [Phanerochaete carnosa HHB-10118-sp]
MELTIVPSCVRILAWWNLQEAVEWPGNTGRGTKSWAATLTHELRCTSRRMFTIETPGDSR